MYKLTCSTGFFEALKLVLFKHLEPEIEKGNIKIRENFDKDHALVQTSLFIKDQYTINVYNITSRMIVHGKKYHKFHDVAKSLMDTIDAQFVTQLNDHLLECLKNIEANKDKLGDAEEQPSTQHKAILASNNGHQHNVIPKRSDQQHQYGNKAGKSTPSRRKAGCQKTSRAIKSSAPLPSGQDSETYSSNEEEDSCMCPICLKPVQEGEDGLQCSVCNDWTHLICDTSISQATYEDHKTHPDKVYKCPSCTLLSNYLPASPPETANADRKNTTINRHNPTITTPYMQLVLSPENPQILDTTKALTPALKPLHQAHWQPAYARMDSHP